VEVIFERVFNVSSLYFMISKSLSLSKLCCFWHGYHRTDIVYYYLVYFFSLPNQIRYSISVNEDFNPKLKRHQKIMPQGDCSNSYFNLLTLED